VILTANKLSAESVNNQPELDPNTFSLLLSIIHTHRQNNVQITYDTDTTHYT